MPNWIDYSLEIKGRTVDLLPMASEHFADLSMLAQDKRIWEFYTFDGSDSDTLKRVCDTALFERDQGNQIPFVIYHKSRRNIIGSTRLMDIQPRHKKLEIGGTWLHPDYWASAVNLECKLLLLTHCFEMLGTVRVQLKTDENNWRSRKAIEKIGGRFEGILRHDMLRDDGSKRNSAYFSITDDEWPEKKRQLSLLYQNREA